MALKQQDFRRVTEVLEKAILSSAGYLVRVAAAAFFNWPRDF